MRCEVNLDMSWSMTNPRKWPMGPLKTLISAVWYESLLCIWKRFLKPWSHTICDCIGIALRPKHWQLQRGLKGLGKVLLKSPKDLRSVAVPNWSWAVFWAHTKDWPRLIWSLRGFIGGLEVSKRSYISCRSISDGAAIGFTTKRVGIFAM